MNTTTLPIDVLCGLGFRLFVLLAGTLIAFWGYQLSAKSRGSSNNPSKLTASRGGMKISLIAHEPGIFFALFGAGIVLLGAYGNNSADRLVSIDRANSVPHHRLSYDTSDFYPTVSYDSSDFYPSSSNVVAVPHKPA